ncbi:hypothetical protein ACHAXA_008373 [Cyclostephanos tholiformis]|uniref:Uncharacterized protein n=1 Tax=Cyclostephanos tholiformis TaxID=382380 RepID=A0ABD3R4Q6_9STRA
MASEDIYLLRFGQYCRYFYDSSLVLRPTSSSSSLTSLQDEKKADDKSIGADLITKKNYCDGKIAIEALDRIIAIRSIVGSIQQQAAFMNELQCSIDNFRHEHALIAERHHATLAECGLLDIDRFIVHSRAHHDCADRNGEDSSSLLQKYAQMRDATRRRAHKISMYHRQNSLFELLLEFQVDDPANPRMNQMHAVQNSISTVKKFVRNYQSNIGSHPFLAGLHRVVKLQMACTDPSHVVRWRFRGSVLMEACRSCHGQDDDHMNYDMAYARDAIKVIFSFLIWIKHVDMECGSYIIPIDEIDSELNDHKSQPTNNEEPEPFLSFEIDKHISNATLRRILLAIPEPKYLDARATGSVEVLDATSNDPESAVNGVVRRQNIDGQEDEQLAWFARIEFCNVL